MMVRRVLVLGGGTAGLLAALTLKRKLPHLIVRVVRSADIGIIGVGEGTTLPFRRHLFDYLGLAKAAFYAEAEPTWKLGLRFLWGPVPVFYYAFAAEHAARWPGLQRNNGFYVNAETAFTGPTSALMHHGKAFPRRLDGWPQIHDDHAFHIENARLAAYLEARCR